MDSIPGIDMDEGLRRAGNHLPLYLRYLKRFPEDSSFPLLREALDAGHMRDAFLHAHTLKGLTTQLGISSLHEPLCILCDTLRGEKNCALSDARKQLAALTPIYSEVVRQIRELP